MRFVVRSHVDWIYRMSPPSNSYPVVLTAFAVLLTIQDHGIRVPVYNSLLFKYSRISAYFDVVLIHDDM